MKQPLATACLLFGAALAGALATSPIANAVAAATILVGIGFISKKHGVPPNRAKKARSPNRGR